MDANMYLAAISLPGNARKTLQKLQGAVPEDEFVAAIQSAVQSCPASEGAARTLAQLCAAHDISYLTPADDEYPPELLSVPGMPRVLFCRGNRELLAETTARIAIVGARNADAEGIEIALHFADTLARAGAVIVSGLALGIDAAAHRGSLRGNREQRAIAVLAHGLDTLYPRSNERLGRKILEQNGLLLSQYPPGTPARPHQFLERNLIIAGISGCTLVVQAGERSGSLATARFALESGRDVCAIPGGIKNPRHTGTNRIIQQGAHLVQLPEDVLALFPALEATRCDLKQQGNEMSVLAREIIAFLSEREQAHFTEIAAAVSNPAHIHRELLQLQLDGSIMQRPGNCYARQLVG